MLQSTNLDLMGKDLALLDVPRETLENLLIYCQELMRWNQHINLLAKEQTVNINGLWQRHIIDSLELLVHARGRTVVDIGSGSGLPAAVLSMAGIDKVCLIEPNYKKVSFLNYVRNKVNGKWEIFDNTMEAYVRCQQTAEADLITSRAFATCKHIVDGCWPIISPRTTLLLPKSSNQWAEETEALRQSYDFNLQVLPNKDTNKGVLLKISNLSLV